METDHVPAELHKALGRLGGSVELLRDVASIFLEDHGQIASDLRKAIQSGDAAAAERAAHSLKGLSSNFDRAQLVERCDRIEKLARAGSLVEAGPLLADVHRETVNLTRALREFLNDGNR